jgi:cyclopropane fatty-acyl-phospholipid synthase-like methyltransferase
VVEDVWKGEGSRIDWTQYEGLSFEAFRRRALDPSLSASEKIGFPDALREGAEDQILDSIATLVELGSRSGLLVVDIGCGCGELTRRMVELCAARGHELVLVDSAEVLSQLPDASSVRKMPGRFPDPGLDIDEYAGRADAVIVYSVLQIVFVEASVFEFVDAALELLASGGALLIGDVPNISKRKRFFASERGAAFHRAFMDSDEDPDVDFNVIERGKIDDSVVLGLLARARAQGFDAYVLPQAPELRLANRREDVLIRRP